MKTVTIDAVGLMCPLPVLKLRKALQSADEVHLLADDPVAVVDVPHFCAQAGHQMISAEPQGAARLFIVRSGSAAD